MVPGAMDSLRQSAMFHVKEIGSYRWSTNANLNTLK